MDRAQSLAPAEWTPIRVIAGRPTSGHPASGDPTVEWADLRPLRFVDPFFDQTVLLALRRPYNLLFRAWTPISELLAAAERTGSRPSGFVFHLSRCGSTLVTRMLAALDRHIVLSEPESIATLLETAPAGDGASAERKVAWLRALIGRLGQPRFEGERFSFVKFDPWQVLDLPLLRRAFPGVPWIFVYRDPVEVLVSQQERVVGRMLPGVLPPALLDLEPAAAFEMPLGEYQARALGKFCATAAEHLQADGLAIHHSQLPGALEQVTRHFGLEIMPQELERMLAVSEFNAKQPNVTYVDDGRRKRDAATDEVRRLADRWVRPGYERLEALRESRARA